MAEGARIARQRHSRFWLYGPVLLLAVVAVGWSLAWIALRAYASGALDAWLAAEAAVGRQWTCPDRAISGYPFRLELACSSLALKRGDATASVGPVTVLARVYRPRDVIAEIGSPLRFGDGRVAGEGEWRRLETSFRASRNGLERASLAVDAPRVRVSGLGPEALAVAGGRVDAHLRQNPEGGGPGLALDATVNLRDLKFAPLDTFVGGSEPAHIQVEVSATQADVSEGWATLAGIERWREAGGQVGVTRLSLEKGARRLEGKGTVRLDNEHRPAGQLNIAGAGLDSLIANLTGGRGGGILSVLLRQAPRSTPAQPEGQSALSPLPPLRFDNGLVSFGPFVLPGVRLTPLY